MRPIFLHSLFRTGSTYIWNKFRKNENYHCYYEPFHEILLNLSEEVLKEDLIAKTTMMAHPKLDRHYLYEYPLRPEGGVPFFMKEFTVDTYCLSESENDDLIKYIKFLIDYTPKQAVFGFCRSSLRSAWLKKHFDSINIYILRNHRDQWQSYLSFKDRYFNIIDLMIVGKHNGHPRFHPLMNVIPIPMYADDSFKKEYQFYENLHDYYSMEELYCVFFYIWLLAYLENYSVCDLTVNIDELAVGSKERDRISEKLKTFGIDVGFHDCRIKSYDEYSLSEKEMTAIEADVIKLIVYNKLFDISTIRKAYEYLGWSIEESLNKEDYVFTKYDTNRKLVEFLTVIGEKNEKLRQMTEHLRQKDELIKLKDELIRQYHNSYSWKLTAPLRAVRAKFLRGEK